jgi:2-dehydro-3-deoxy-D-gluconate 5-dehydrogenase
MQERYNNPMKNILDSFRLDGNVALVTGASRGLGQAMAMGLAEAGADVVGLSSSPSCNTARQIEAFGRIYYPIQHNLLRTPVEKFTQIIATIVEEFGHLDILVNNAGITRRAPLLEFSEQDWEDVIDVNLRAVFYLSQAAARIMVEKGRGKIINIASLLSFQGGILIPSYTASKSGVAGLTRLMANELAAKNINVNAIAPGYIETDLTQPLLNDPARAPSLMARIPAGRWGSVEDLKGITVFLASSASDYMHGTVIPVDGGWMAR